MKYALRAVIVLLTVAFLLVPANVASAHITNWTMFGYGPAHTRYNPYETMLNTSNVSQLSLAWSVQSYGQVDSMDTLISNGIAYFITADGSVHAVNAATGVPLWRDRFDTNFRDTSPAIFNGLLYIEMITNVAPYYTSLYALNAYTGTLRWTVDGVGPFAPPTIANGILYAGGAFNTFYALNPSTGAILWQDTSGPDTDYILNAPAVVGGVVYLSVIASANGVLYAVNGHSGSILWQAPIASEPTDSPAIANGFLYVGSYNGPLYAYSIATRQVVWTFAGAGGEVASPAVANGLVYISGNGPSNQAVYALNATTGTLVWTGAMDNSTWASATVANGVVYDESFSGTTYAFNALDGTPLWTSTLGTCQACASSSPVVANGMLYIGVGKTFSTYHVAS